MTSALEETAIQTAIFKRGVLVNNECIVVKRCITILYQYTCMFITLDHKTKEAEEKEEINDYEKNTHSHPCISEKVRRENKSTL